MVLSRCRKPLAGLSVLVLVALVAAAPAQAHLVRLNCSGYIMVRYDDYINQFDPMEPNTWVSTILYVGLTPALCEELGNHVQIDQGVLGICFQSVEDWLNDEACDARHPIVLPWCYVQEWPSCDNDAFHRMFICGRTGSPGTTMQQDGCPTDGVGYAFEKGDGIGFYNDADGDALVQIHSDDGTVLASECLAPGTLTHGLWVASPDARGPQVAWSTGGVCREGQLTEAPQVVKSVPIVVGTAA